jgi:hypothetical protein
MRIEIDGAKTDYGKLIRQADDQIEQIARNAKLRRGDDKLTMDDFWIGMGWFRTERDRSLKLTHAKWKDDEQAQVIAIRYMVNRILTKDPRNITNENFADNRLQVLINYYNGSLFEAVSKAFPELNIKAWEMAVTPRYFYKKRKNREDAVRWLVAKLGKDPRDMIREDFLDNKQGGLITHYFKSSPYRAVSETYPELGIRPWEMAATPQGVYGKKKNRGDAVRWLVAKLKKNPRDVTKEDFYENRLGGLLTSYFNGSPFEAMFEVGLVDKEDEDYMRARGNNKIILAMRLGR